MLSSGMCGVRGTVMGGEHTSIYSQFSLVRFSSVALTVEIISTR